jgi:hypothetical protein
MGYVIPGPGVHLQITENDEKIVFVLFSCVPTAYNWHTVHAVMTKVAILPELSPEGSMMYRAVGGAHQALAKTAGAALDALTAQLPAEETGTMVIVQNHRPDQFFTAQQQQRLGHLMDRWRAARDVETPLSPGEQAELSELVDAEVEASGRRAAAALADLGK